MTGILRWFRCEYKITGSHMCVCARACVCMFHWLCCYGLAYNIYFRREREFELSRVFTSARLVANSC